MKTNEVPLILRYGNRVILWGCEIDREYLRVSLAFFNRGITTPIVKLKDRQGNLILKAELPEMYIKNSHRGRAQNILLKIAS